MKITTMETPEILIVEDSETQARYLAHLLESAGFSVRIAGDGAQGLEQARQRQPTLVVSDIAMPVMDGFAMCRAIKNDPLLRNVPVILLTALASLHDVIKGLDCGADNFIRKPVEPQYLIGRIRFILSNRIYRSEERVQLGMKINLGGQTHFINAERQQIFDLLISTYEEAIQMTEQLRDQQATIAHSYQSLEGLYKIAEALNPALTERDVASMALDRMLELPGMAGGAILLIDGEGRERVETITGSVLGDAVPEACRGSACITGIVDGLGTERQTHRVSRCDSLFGPAQRGESATQVCVPLAVGDHSFGHMLLLEGGRELGPEDMQVLDTAGRQIAVALERARLYTRMESLVEERTAALRNERNLLSAVVDTTAALVFMVDSAGRIVIFNSGCEKALGWTQEETRGRYFWEFIASRETGVLESLFSPAGTELQQAKVETVCLARDGSERRIMWTTTCLRGDDNAIQYIVGTGLDVTELEGAKQKVQYLSHFDPLTGLPNRMVLSERYRAMRQYVASTPGQVIGMLMVRCERMPLIRESLGLAVEQGLILTMTERLRDWKHADDSLARFDDLSFALVVVRAEVSELDGLARELIALLDRPFTVGEQELHPETTVGIAVAPTDGNEFDMLVRASQAAARRASGTASRYAFHQPELSRAAHERFKMEGALRHALERQELVLHYQPQVDLRSGQVIGVEALVRWRHPQLGMVPPGSFIALAEETGMILAIGDWVLREACRQAAAWQAMGLRPMPVAVNLSARQFSAQIVDSVKSALRETGLDAQYLELELTESVSMDDPENTFRILGALKDMGVLLAIDDFGTGYSNLNYLKRFPVDKVKLDQSFVRELTSDPDDLAIAGAVISMAHSLRLRVVAEGVETEGQLAILARKGCDEMQGYLFSRPVDGEAIAALLAAGTELPLAQLAPAPYERRLLFVDDDANTRAAVRRMTRNKDFTVCFAGSAEEAYELMATREISVVLCDQRMPRVSGTEFLTRVKHLHPDTVRMVLSGYTDLKSVTDAVNHGNIFKFLHKPWDDADLLAALEEAFARYEQNTRGHRQAA